MKADFVMAMWRVAVIGVSAVVASIVGPGLTLETAILAATFAVCLTHVLEETFDTFILDVLA